MHHKLEKATEKKTQLSLATSPSISSLEPKAVQPQVILRGEDKV